MFSAKEFIDTIKNSRFYDAKFEYQNLSYDELLNVAASQKIVLDDLNDKCAEYSEKINELSNYIAKLENSLLIIKR